MISESTNNMTSNTMNSMRDGGFMDTAGELHEFMDNNAPNMGINNQQQMSSNTSQKSQFSQQGNGSTNQFMNNQFNQVVNQF